MSTFKAEVVPITLEKHPNADSLSIVRVYGFPVVVRTEDWQGEELGAYIPLDAIVPDTEDFAFLQGHLRIRAKKLRGIFSQGILVPAPLDSHLGDDVTDLLGITRYAPSEPLVQGGENAPAPGVFVPTYTDIESLRRYPHILQEGEEIVVTEKIHGVNGRWFFHDGTFHVGSHHQWRREDPTSVWWKVLSPHMREVLQEKPLVWFGEVYGYVKELRYGAKPGQVSLAIFDIYDPFAGTYLDWPDFLRETQRLPPDVHTAPILRWSEDCSFARLEQLAEEDSILGGDNQKLMEGIVVRLAHERFHEEIGRVILKLHSQRYLLKAE